jgi:hypothetical protein
MRRCDDGKLLAAVDDATSKTKDVLGTHATSWNNECWLYYAYIDIPQK